MKNILKYLITMMLCMTLCITCNNEWEDEQFDHYVSFVAPLNDQGVSPIYLRYKANGTVTYQVPLMVSGSTVNDKNLNVFVAVDPDTLDALNVERFSTRTELFFKRLPNPQFFTFPGTVNIPSGSSHATLPIDFKFNGIDMVDKWVVPLKIENDPNYQANPRRHYKRALLRIFPFNDYSGVYGATGFLMYFKDTGTSSAPLALEFKTAYVVDENTVFFYAGIVTDEWTDRANYKIFFRFNDDYDEDLNSGTITINADNPNIKLNVVGTPTYRISERMDDTRPYLKRRITTIYMEYDFTDYTSMPGYEIDYLVRGSLTMERVSNTQIPDEDQAIQW